MGVDPTVRTAPTRETYLEYLKTGHWKAVRNRALQRARYRCQRCGNGRDVQVHHLTYERLGAEVTSDLEVVCRRCHRDEHLDHPEPSAALYLKIVREALNSMGPWAPIADIADHAKTLCAERKIRYDGPRINRAIDLIVDRRLKRSDEKPQPHVIGEYATHDLTKDEARELVARLFDEVPTRLVRPMPKALPPNPKRHDAAKALKMIFEEIQSSIELCEALERDADASENEPSQ